MIKMKLAYILPKYPRQVEGYIRDEISELQKYCDVTIFSMTKSREKNTLNIKVVYPKKSYNFFKILKWAFYLTFKSWKDIKWIPIALGFSKEIKNNYNHIHTWGSSTTATISYIILKETGTPFSFSCHSADIFVLRGSKKLLIKKIKHAKFVLVPSRWHFNYMLNIYNKPEKYYIIPNSVHPNKFKPWPTRKNNRRIITICRPMEKKGLPYLVKAIERLRTDEPNIEYTHISGGISDTELLEKLNRADVFVLPCIRAKNGDMDGIPTAILEAMSMEIPIITTSIHDGLIELVKSCGYAVEPYNSEELYKTIKNLLNKPYYAKKLGKVGRKRILKDYNIVKNARKLAELLKLDKHDFN